VFHKANNKDKFSQQNNLHKMLNFGNKNKRKEAEEFILQWNKKYKILTDF